MRDRWSTFRYHTALHTKQKQIIFELVDEKLNNNEANFQNKPMKFFKILI